MHEKKDKDAFRNEQYFLQALHSTPADYATGSWKVVYFPR
jgi:hypothetical protein